MSTIVQQLNEIQLMLSWPSYPPWPLRCSLSVHDVKKINDLVKEIKENITENKDI